MEDLEDELDLRYHRGLQPDVYYRCPTLESLDGALRNEIEKNASSLIPVEIVTEFIFAAASTITIPVAQQPALDALIEPAEYLQSIMVDYALCRDIEGKDRMKVQRAVARSILEAIQEVDGFKYVERSSENKEGTDGARLKYVCQDSVQHKTKLSRKRKEKRQDSEEREGHPNNGGDPAIIGYGCGGAVHVKFSTKREAIHVVYKHNSIHGRPVDDDSLPALAFDTASTSRAPRSKVPKGNKDGKAKRKKKAADIDIENDCRDPDMDMSTSPEAPRASVKRKRKENGVTASPNSTRESTAKKSKKGKEPLSQSASRSNAQVVEPPAPPMPVKGKCIRCREMKIKCNEGKPACNQCKRGLWPCQYEVLGTKSKRSKNGCINCKARKRKCTDEQPSCAHCLKIDDDCKYAAYSRES